MFCILHVVVVLSIKYWLVKFNQNVSFSILYLTSMLFARFIEVLVPLLLLMCDFAHLFFFYLNSTLFFNYYK